MDKAKFIDKVTLGGAAVVENAIVALPWLEFSSAGIGARKIAAGVHSNMSHTFAVMQGAGVLDLATGDSGVNLKMDKATFINNITLGGAAIVERAKGVAGAGVRTVAAGTVAAGTYITSNLQGYTGPFLNGLTDKITLGGVAAVEGAKAALPALEYGARTVAAGTAAAGAYIASNLQGYTGTFLNEIIDKATLGGAAVAAGAKVALPALGFGNARTAGGCIDSNLQGYEGPFLNGSQGPGGPWGQGPGGPFGPGDSNFHLMMDKAKFIGKVTLGGAVVVTGATVALPLLGFGTAGVGAGTVAAGVQSYIGCVSAGSTFAAMQSAGVLGLAAGTKLALAGAGAYTTAKIVS